MKNKLLNIYTTITLLLFSNLLLAQPDLGTAANFVVFSTDGAIFNTGNSHFTGNVGRNVAGAVNVAVNVNGIVHIGDAAAISCAAGLQNAYNDINAAIQTGTHAVLLGGGETVNAGVYGIAGASTLNGILTLDGQSNPNAVFIFRVSGGTFSSTANSEIILINGAQACNVFWKVEGAVSLGTSTIFKGTIIANNAAVDLTAGVNLEGRAFSTAGAVSVNSLEANIPVGCNVPLLTGPAAPTLGSTACYGLFSASGTVSNAVSMMGETFVTGDIGSNFGTASGYNPLNVTGTIHPIPDASTGAAAADLAALNSSINALTPDIELLYPALFGGGLVLTPHTYLLNGATTFTDILYLNADGNANAVFVIKINGALSTNINAQVILLNGAQSKNVFWQVDGAVNINDNSTFRGTILGKNGAITLNTGSILRGRALATNGNVATTFTSATIPLSDCTVLPLSWLYFKGTPVQNNVVLEWATADEINNRFFTVEKSSDGQNFEAIATVKAHGQTIRSEYRYNFTDKQPSSLAYYRIEQTDNDGRKTQSRIIQISSSKVFKVRHYTQGSFIFIETNNTEAGNGTIELYNIEGKLMSAQKVILDKSDNTYKIEKPNQSGLYLLRVAGQGENNYVGKVMVAQD